MSNLQHVFNDECHRISRKEVKASVVPLAKTVSSLRREVIDLRKQPKAALERLDKVCPVVKAPEKASDPIGAGKKLRLTPARIQKVREKTGLSRMQFAQLLGVNYISVVNWENGKTKAREEQLQKIAQVRGYGKRELKAALDAKNLAPKAAKPGKKAEAVKQETPQAKPAAKKAKEKAGK